MHALKQAIAKRDHGICPIQIEITPTPAVRPVKSSSVTKTYVYCSGVTM